MRVHAGTVVVRVDPTLRPLLSPARRAGAEVVVPVDGTSSLIHMLESLGIPRTEIGALTGPHGPVPSTRIARPGDVVRVVPVARPQRDAPQRYVLDVHLGALARRMRLLGLDTLYRNDAHDPELVDVASQQDRVLLTRDRGLLRRRSLRHGALVAGDAPDVQLADVLDRFDPALAPWTRCPACNGPLHPVSTDSVAHLLQPGTLRTYQEFARCQACGRPYWRGAHAAALQAVVDRALRRP